MQTYMQKMKFLVGVLASIFSLSLWSYAPNITATIQAAPNTDIFVDVNGGSDTSSCGTQSQPCNSIQYAINKAVSGQTIRVAAGTYTYKAAADTCHNVINTTAVVCIRNKELTIIGGYTSNNWSTPDYNANLTIIDGLNSKRGIILQHGIGQPPATLVMEGFTVQNGRAQGASSGSQEEIFAFGGGVRADRSTLILRHMIFKNNRAVGGNTNINYGGSGAGGAIAVRSGLSGSRLEHVTFTGNQAIGGSGLQRGGFGIGGGVFLFDSVVHAEHITATNNLARGGSSNGSGIDAGENADAQGGAIAVQISSVAEFRDITVTSNQAVGGDAANGQGGGSFGGGLFAEEANLTITGALFQSNVAEGGIGRNESSGGSIAVGGGISTHQSYTFLDRVSVVNNRASGGNGTVIDGSGNGGGGSFIRVSGSSTITIINSLFADNLAEMGTGPGSSPGGGGGGLYLRGTAATVKHVTFARNKLGSSPMQGNGILLLNAAAATASTATFANSIIAQHTEYSNAFAVHVQPGNTVTLQTGLFDGNNNNTGGGGAVNGLGTMISGQARFVSPSEPNYDYHIQSNSAAKDTAVNSQTTLDFDGDSRDNNPDIGADEYVPPSITAVYGIPIASGEVRVQWETSYMDNTLDHFELTVSCPSGASRPNEMPCGATVNVGTQTSFLLSGMTNYREYSVEVRAYNSSDQLISAMSSTFTPVDIFVYLPLVAGE